MAWIGLIIAAAAALGKAYQDRQVSKRQSNELEEGLAQQREDEAKARAKIEANLGNFAPSKAASTKAAEQQSYLQQVQQATGQNGPYQADKALGASVALSNKRAAGTAAKDNTLAKLFGTIGAAGVQRQNENIGTAQTGSYLNQVTGSAQRQMQAKELAAQSIHANPWTRLILNFAEAYGLGSAGGVAGAAAGAGADSMTGGYTDNSGYTYNVPQYATNQ
jgi:hypothetical protein